MDTCFGNLMQAQWSQSLPLTIGKKISTHSNIHVTISRSNLWQYDVTVKAGWKKAYPSFSNRPLQSTTGPPLPMRSRVCKLTAKNNNKQVTTGGRVQTNKIQGREGAICTHSAPPCVQPYRQSAPELHHCPRGSAYIDRDAGLEEEDKTSSFKPKWHENLQPTPPPH